MMKIGHKITDQKYMKDPSHPSQLRCLDPGTDRLTIRGGIPT